MHTLPFSKIRSFIITLALVVLAGGVGYRFGEEKKPIPFFTSRGQSVVQSPELVNTTPSEGEDIDFALFWDVWQKMYRYYIDAPSLNAQKMVYGAISGMVAAAQDPYTTFLPPKENTDFKQDIGGEFEGIGAQLDLKDERIVIVTPLKDSPAEKAGILAGDIILKVNDEDTQGWSVADAVAKIRGPKLSTVNLTILHEKASESVVIPVIRDTILVPSVESWVKAVSTIEDIKDASASSSLQGRNDQIAYIKLSRFGDHTTQDWANIVDDISKAYDKDFIKGLVFDLRNNPGGYLEGSVFIGSEFISSGTIVSQKNSDGSVEHLTVNRKGKLTKIPIVVLINKGSASAAEIVAGALKDHKRAKIVGETSFGKGSVQTPYELSGGASVHITTGKWLLPNGDSISEKGVTPDVIVPMTTFEKTKDEQLARAIEVLLE